MGQSLECAYCSPGTSDDSAKDPCNKLCEGCGWKCKESSAKWCQMCGEKLVMNLNLNGAKFLNMAKIKVNVPEEDSTNFLDNVSPANVFTAQASPSIWGKEDVDYLEYQNGNYYSPSPFVMTTVSTNRYSSSEEEEHRTKDPDLALNPDSIRFHKVDSIQARAEELKKFMDEQIAKGDLITLQDNEMKLYRYTGKNSGLQESEIKRQSSLSVLPEPASGRRALTTGAPSRSQTPTPTKKMPGGGAGLLDLGGEDLRCESLERKAAARKLKGGEDIRAASLDNSDDEAF